MFDLISNHENKVFITGQELLGVENVNFTYSNSYSVTRFIGMSGGAALVSNDVQKNLSFSRYLIYNDPILSMNRMNPISGSIHYNGGSYGFTSGFLTEYGVNCAVGAVPNISTSLAIFGEMKSGINASGTVATPSIFIPNQGSISLSCDNVSTNRVVGFDYAIKYQREPIYSIGSRFPVDVFSMPNIEYTASVQIDVDDAFLQDATGFLMRRENKTVSFTVRSRDGAQILQSLSIPNASLIGESLSSSADGGVKLTLNYAGQT
jgi:hypothetical protein